MSEAGTFGHAATSHLSRQHQSGHPVVYDSRPQPKPPRSLVKAAAPQGHLPVDAVFAHATQRAARRAAGERLQDIRPTALRQNRKSYGQWPGFPLIFINSDDIREIRDDMADGDRRPKTIACAHCGRKFKIEPFGRVPTYCSASCRSMAFAKNNRGVKVSLEDRQRLRTWSY